MNFEICTSSLQRLLLSGHLRGLHVDWLKILFPRLSESVLKTFSKERTIKTFHAYQSSFNIEIEQLCSQSQNILYSIGKKCFFVILHFWQIKAHTALT